MATILVYPRGLERSFYREKHIIFKFILCLSQSQGPYW